MLTPEQVGNARRNEDPKYQQLQSELNVAQARYQSMTEAKNNPDLIKKGSEKHGAGGAAHIPKAVSGAELGALKLEHGNPMVDLLRKSVELQERTVKALEKKNEDGGNDLDF